MIQFFSRWIALPRHACCSTFRAFRRFGFEEAMVVQQLRTWSPVSVSGPVLQLPGRVQGSAWGRPGGAEVRGAPRHVCWPQVRPAGVPGGAICGAPGGLHVHRMVGPAASPPSSFSPSPPALCCESHVKTPSYQPCGAKGCQMSRIYASTWIFSLLF